MEFRLPELGEGVYEAELTDWLVKPGELVKRGQNLLTVMTDKATMEVPAPFAGKIAALQAEPGQTVKVGDVVLSYDGDSATVEAKPAKAPAPVASTKDGKARPLERNATSAVKAAPSVRYLARRLDIDLATIKGSGPGGRILMEDVAARIKAQPAAPSAKTEELQPDYGKPGSRLKLRGVRRAIAEHMVHAKQTIPHYTYVDECDVTRLVQLREDLREPFARLGVKLTYLAFIVKAAALALRDVPLVNASLDDSAGEIVLHDRYHIGIAVATPQGLMVPVVRDVERKDLTQIARDIDQLSTAARTGKLRPEDLRDGTFTVTSIGGIGGLISTPIINHPEAAILGIGKVVRRPVYDQAGQIRPADLMYLSFSFDHRVLDGAVGAVFGNAIKSRLEAPAQLLLADKLA